jgi:hypothetical protein
MVKHTVEEKKNSTLCKHRFPSNTLTHSTNEDLLNIKRKCDPEVSYPLSYVRYHWNLEPVCNKSHFANLFYFILIFLNLLNLFWHTDKNFCFYAEVNFWDFVRNDNSNKGTTARLNETRFGPKKKSSPVYLGAKNLDTFWCTACNCQIIFRCASIHGRAGFILILFDHKFCKFNPTKFYKYKQFNLLEIHPLRTFGSAPAFYFIKTCTSSFIKLAGEIRNKHRPVTDFVRVVSVCLRRWHSLKTDS